MIDTSIQVRTDQFDGPLALLLFLIEKEEMDIRKLDLAKITKQYLDYLSKMQELNFDVAGEYLYLAATLLLLKSKSCISEDEMSRLKDGIEGADGLNIPSQAELIRRLEELQHFQKMGQLLWSLPKKGHEIFTRPRIDRKSIINSILMPMDLNTLIEAMVGLIQKEKRKYTVLKRDRLSIKEKLVFLKEYLSQGQKLDFENLIEQDGGKNIDNIVITFISLLELARLKRLSLFQNENYGAIYIDVLQSLEDFDVNQANGFEEEGAENQASSDELPALPAPLDNQEVQGQEGQDHENILQ